LAVGLDVALVARHILHDCGLDTCRECAGTSGVDHGGDGTGTVSGNDVEGTGDHAAVRDLRERVAALSHSACDHGNGVLALTLSFAESIGGDVGLSEDSCVGLGDLVPAWARNDAALNANGGTVASSVTLDYGDLAVGRDEGGGHGGEDESGETHDGRSCLIKAVLRDVIE
jgi:hypothetical protein